VKRLSHSSLWSPGLVSGGSFLPPIFPICFPALACDRLEHQFTQLVEYTMLCSELLTPLHKKFSRAQTYYSSTDISIFSFTSTASAACLHRCKLRHGLGLLCRTPIDNIVCPHSSSVVVETRHEVGGAGRHHPDIHRCGQPNNITAGNWALERCGKHSAFDSAYSISLKSMYGHLVTKCRVYATLHPSTLCGDLWQPLHGFSLIMGAAAALLAKHCSAISFNQ
jgi:hypothetical protein